MQHDVIVYMYMHCAIGQFLLVANLEDQSNFIVKFYL